MAWFGLFKQQPKKMKDVALVANFTSCRLGRSVHAELNKVLPTVGVAHNGAENGGFSAFLNEEEDRARLIAYLKANDMHVKYLVIN